MSDKPPDTEQPEKSSKIIPFQSKSEAVVLGKKKEIVMDVKVKLTNYMSIFNNCQRNSAIEKKALGKLAELVTQVPDTDKEKHEYLRLVVDFYEGTDEEMKSQFGKLMELVKDVANKEEQLRTYRILLRSKQADAEAKDLIATTMMDIMETD